MQEDRTAAVKEHCRRFYFAGKGAGRRCGRPCEAPGNFNLSLDIPLMLA